MTGGILIAEYTKTIQDKPVTIEWGDETAISNCTQVIPCESNVEIARFIARNLAEAQLYGTTALEKTEVDSWLTFSIGPLIAQTEFASAIAYLNKALAPLTFLVGKRLTIADFITFSTLYGMYLA